MLPGLQRCAGYQMNRIEEIFSSAGRPLFIAFTVAGDPDFDTSVAAAKALIEGGADIIELGVPFSDPVADGPTIQRADVRALGAGATPEMVFEIVRRIRLFSKVPVVLLTYYNIVYRRGISRFYRDAGVAGVDGILIADMPFEESGPVMKEAAKTGIDQIFMVSETTSPERLEGILEKAQGFLYLVSHMGVTGVLPSLPKGAAAIVQHTRFKTSMPLAVGFGVTTPAHAAELYKAGADAAIAGSAIVSLIENHKDDPAQMKTVLKEYAISMRAATNTKSGA
jgi:tryptophan synthase alpha chain